MLTLLLGAAQASAQATPCADLFITDVGVNPDPPVAGTPTVISVTVHNGGTCTAPGFVVQWRRDRFASTGPSKSVASLGAGEDATVVVSSDFTYPSPGNFQSIAEVDTGSAVSETNENNNLEQRSITVVEATRNLTITDVSFSPDPVVRGRQMTANVTIENTGNSPTAAFRVEWTPFIFGTPLSRQVPGMAPGETRVVSFNFTYPFDGTVDTTASVDTTNVVAETNEFDNTFSKRLVVEPPLPDLEITNVVVDAAPAGSTTTVRATVTNTGNDPAATFRVTWQPWLFAAPLSEEIGGLAVGQSQTVQFEYVFPFEGTFDGTITADSLNAVPEVSESNNTAATHITVARATVDLTVTDLHIECAGRGGEGPSLEGTCQNGNNPVQGEPITAVITVKNLGNTPSGRFVTEWNPDTFEIIPQGPHTVSEETGPLGPGASRVIRLLFTYPRAGNFRTIANVDAFNTVQETVETNNEKILNLVVDPAPIDLVFDGPIVFNPAQPVRGVDATATVTVRNAGPIATGPFGVQFKSQDADFFPQTQFVNGLNPGETRTLTFTTNYFTAGTFTATAVVDVFNQVLEPGFRENNNTITQSVTVVPQSAVLNVRLDNLRVLNDLDPPPILSGDGEWNPILFAVFDPTASCQVNIDRGPLDINETIPGLRCVLFNGGSVDDEGDNIITTNRTLTVRLEEATPLLAAVAVLEDDDPFTPDFPGFATFLSFRPDYLHLPQQNLPGQSCATITILPPGINPVGDGHCFDARLSVIPGAVVGPTARAKARTKAGRAVAIRALAKGSKAAKRKGARRSAARRNAASRRAYIKRAKVPAATKRLATRRAAYLQKALLGLRRKIARQSAAATRRGATAPGKSKRTGR